MLALEHSTIVPDCTQLQASIMSLHPSLLVYLYCSVDNRLLRLQPARLDVQTTLVCIL